MKEKKLGSKCPLCGSPLSNEAWNNTKTKKVCRLVCPASLENGGNRSSCDIFCYFSCAKRDISITYRDILKIMNQSKDLGWYKSCDSTSCDDYIKVYGKIFKRCFSLLPSNKSFRFK